MRVTTCMTLDRIHVFACSRATQTMEVGKIICWWRWNISRNDKFDSYISQDDRFVYLMRERNHAYAHCDTGYAMGIPWGHGMIIQQFTVTAN